MPELNRNKITGTFGFNTVDSLIVAVQSQQTGAATKDCAVLWWLHVFLYEGMYFFCECITLEDFFQPELLGPKSVETKTYF